MNTLESFSDFEAAERARGCSEVIVRSRKPLSEQPTHTHPFSARALVVEGELWLTVDGATRHLLSGDRFEVPAGTPHSERYGPQGATLWAARTRA